MIIIRMSGGLGNQMFQYALYHKLCAIGRRAVIDDVTEYRKIDENGKKRKRRPRMLHIFGIVYPKATQEELIRMTDADLSLPSRIRRKLTGRKTKEKRDRDFVFDPSFLETEEGYFCGCFQSPRYFAGEEESLRKIYVFPENILEDLPASQKIRNEIRKRQAEGIPCAAIHLRFGDYLDHQDLYGGICTKEYYLAGIGYLQRHCPGVHFFVFSNDAEKAGEFVSGMETPAAFTVAEGNDEDHGYADLYLMSLCDHFIIANSSFSWWGAWLGKKPSSVTIAPTLWMRTKDGSELERTDIFTEEMVRIAPDGALPGEETPLVSVIVAAYNIQEYLPAALDSLLSQTYPNLEIIAVDDGSNDDTGRICDAYAGEHENIRVIHKKNGGLSDARNAGLAVARGEYIGYLDGDDTADPFMFETMVKGCLYTGAGIATVKYREVFSEEAENGPEDGDPRDPAFVDGALRQSVLLSRERALDLWIRTGLQGNSEKYIIYNSVWSKLFRRDVIESLTFPVGRNSEDIMYTTKALCASDKTLVIPFALYRYLQDRAGSIMNVSLGERRLTHEIPFWEEHIRYLRENGLEELSRRAEYYFYRRLLFYDMDFRKKEELAPYAKALEEKLSGNRERILEVMTTESCRSRGDVARMKLLLSSPSLYHKCAAFYEKHIVPLRSRT